MVEQQTGNASVQHFRAYPVRRMIDVQVASMAIQRDDLFPDVESQIRSNLSTIVLELGTNIVKYAGSGRILLRSLRGRDGAGIEVLAVDEGPGIADVAQALEDHYTTGRSLGLGLGVVRRLASSFEMSCPESGGTRVRALCWWPLAPARPQTRGRRSPEAPAVPVPDLTLQGPPLQITSHGHNRPALHQQESGDALLQLDHGDLAIRILLDGAGHGPIAHGLSSRAAAALRQHLEAQLAVLVDDGTAPPLSEAGLEALMLETANRTHEQIRGSRGVAMGMAVFNRRARRVHFLGVGNTRILLLRWKGWEGVSRDGQLGVSFRTPVISRFPLQPGDVVLQSSDGIRTSTLRAMRPRRREATIDPEQVVAELLSRSSYSDDVSLLLSRCHA